MGQHIIKLFMWGYQPHFRVLLESRAKAIFKQLGVEVEVKVLLVGALSPQSQNQNPVCVEPEDGEWSLELFNNLQSSIEQIIASHELQDIFYSDEQSMRDKPEMIRRDSVNSAVRQALSPYDTQQAVHSFCGNACLVENYYVVPVIQIPDSVFQQFPPLKKAGTTDRWTPQGPSSFIHACMGVLLKEATAELYRPDPGRSHMEGMRRADEIVRDGATSFMQTPGLAVTKGFMYADLFMRFNLLSSMMYEGTKGSGHLLLVNPENEAIDYLLRFDSPIPFNEPRWARKVLQMATNEIALIADGENIYGLGKLPANYDYSLQNAFVVDFIDHYHWEIRCGSQVLLRSRYGEPKLPQELINEQRFKVNYARLFPASSPADHTLLWTLFNTAIQLSHGCMIVVAEDAAEEAERLRQQGSIIEPTQMSVELLRRVSGIDGTIILDPHGICYAVGVILDGAATVECTPSRGSRFNSGIRYLKAGNKQRMAIVVSEDHTVDLIPLMPPQIKWADLESNISKLERATLDDYHKPRSWVDNHRFYLNASQCTRVNLALDRIEALPRDVGEILITTRRFEPDDQLDDSFLI
jgi:hypothetical protein